MDKFLYEFKEANMYHLLKNKKGQSTLEYIIIFAVIAAVIVIVAPIIAQRYQAGADTASSQITANAAAISDALAP